MLGRTRCSKSVSQAGFYAGSLAGNQSRSLRRRHLTPVHFVLQRPCGFSKRESERPPSTLKCRHPLVSSTRSAPSQSPTLRALAPFTSRGSAPFSCRHLPRERVTILNHKTAVINHLLPIHLHLSPFYEQFAVSLRLHHHALPHRQFRTATPTPALPNAAGATTGVLLPLTRTRRRQQSATANQLSHATLQASPCHKPARTHHFDYPNTCQTTGSRLLCD